MRPVGLALFLLFPALVRADGIPTIEPLAYSGVLLNSVGAPVTSAVTLRLVLFDSPTANAGTNEKCVTPSQSITPDLQGRFRVVLDGGCLAAVKANPNLWVQVEVSGVILPRSKLSAVPYAVEADRAALATSATTAGSATNATNAVNATNATTSATATALTGSVRSSLLTYRTTGCVYSTVNQLTDCACNTDEYAISGGVYAGLGNVLRESRNAADIYGNGRVWRTVCVNSSTGSQVQCPVSSTICLKVSP